MALTFGCPTACRTAIAAEDWVGQVRTNGPWDYKPQIREVFGRWDYDSDGDAWYYDIWTNIPFGYLGAFVGRDETDLLVGSNLGEMFPEGSLLDRIGGPLAGRNDSADLYGIHIGYMLWEEYGADLTFDQFIAFVEERKWNHVDMYDNDMIRQRPGVPQ